MFFFKKESVAFSARMVCFFVKGFFSQRRQVFSFLKGCGLLLFFKWFGFCCFLQNTRIFLFKMVEFFLKFSSMFWKRKKRFFVF